MENIETILSLAGTAIGLTVTAVTFIAKFLKAANAKKTADGLIAIGNAIIPYIEQAEKFAGYTGAEKKLYVLTKLREFAGQKGIAFDEPQISQRLEELIGLTKEVNA
ncbi:MAG: phage holin family protein [Clostridiales bacterium]|jgi:hypothetical protein|nr:phage holin family protein [Clostridiales bacterium]